MALSPRAGVADTGTTLVAGAAAATAKTVLNVIAASNQSVKATEIGIGFDGVTSSEKPVYVELCSSTQATAGTSTAVTPAMCGGKGTLQSTAAKNYSAEPTVLTLLKSWLVDPNKGALILPFTPGREYESPVAGGLCLRVTIPSGGAAVNLHAYIEFEE